MPVRPEPSPAAHRGLRRLFRPTADRRTASSARPPATLARLTPLGQLRAGRLPRRLVQLYLGLALYGFSMAMMIRAGLGLDPWDVLHQGLTRYLPFSFGTVTAVVGVLVLLAWWPLKQWPGLGTLSNVVVIGVSVDAGLWLLPTIDAPVLESLPSRIALLVVALVANGIAGGAYIGSQLGPGPRDGLMTGLAARTGRSLRLIRTGIEVTVLVIGFLLGGTVGIGTIVYALAIGPLVQFFLRYLIVPLPVNPVDRDGAPSTGQDASTEGRTAATEGRPGATEPTPAVLALCAAAPAPAAPAPTAPAQQH